MVHKGSGIEKVTDLQGKKVGVGNAGSGAFANCELFFTHLGIWDKIERNAKGYNDAAQALGNSQLDAFWLFTAFPSGAVIMAAQTNDIDLVVLVLFYGWAAVVEPAATQYLRGVYIVITYVLVLLLYHLPGAWGKGIDYLLMIASVVTIGYWILNIEAINYRAGAETPLDHWIAMVGVLLGIELARRVVGPVFVFMGGLMLIYGVYGEYAPELISHAGDSFPELATSIFYKSDGVFGIMANVLATYILLFVMFGAFLEKSGAQRFFIDFPLRIVGAHPVHLIEQNEAGDRLVSLLQKVRDRTGMGDDGVRQTGLQR